MAESDLWKTMRDKVAAHGHFERIENMVGRGRPDVNYCVRGHEGNIELKQIKQWPAREETVVELDHFTAQQRLWIRRRCAARGRVYVLLEVVRPIPTYLLMRGTWARTFLGISATRADILRHADVVGAGFFPTELFIDELTSDE
jgi:hypothetical protein